MRREPSKQIEKICTRCSNKYYGQKNGKYCIYCKLDVMDETNQAYRERKKETKLNGK